MSDTDPEVVVQPSANPPAPIGFFASSWNRFVVLNTLGAAPRTRAELQDIADVSRPTLSRILSALTDHGWIVRRNDEYEATPKGRVVAAEFSQLVENVETAERLDGVLEWIRVDQLGFDLALLADAEVLTPDPEDHTGPMRRLADRIDSTNEMRIVATGVTVEIVETICESALNGELRLRCVLDRHGVGGIRARPTLGAKFVEMIELDRCEAYRYTGEVDLLDYNLIDDAVMFCGINDDGLPVGTLLSENNTVRAWAAMKFETLTDQSEPIGVEAFTP